MKAFLLAATMLAAPVFAQSEPPASMSTNTGTPPASSTMSTGTTATDTTAPAAPDAGTMTTQTAAPSVVTGQTVDGDPIGGYQPTSAPTSGGTFQPSADPATAYPPPAPLATYPICKRGQYDGCMERSTASGARHPSQPK